MTEALDEVTARICAIGLILVQKGICQIEEIDKAVVQCRQVIDQKRAADKEKQMNDLRASGFVGQMLAKMVEGE